MPPAGRRLYQSLYGNTTFRPSMPHGFYSAPDLSAGVLKPSGSLPAQRAMGALTMLDLIYLATGAAFLYACVLYAFACDHL
jgi:hypothetical protein